MELKKIEMKILFTRKFSKLIQTYFISKLLFKLKLKF